MQRSLGFSFVLFVLILAFVVSNSGCAGVTAASKASTVKVSAAISVSITPANVSIQAGGTQQFTATVTGLANTSVTWSATAGSISNSGLYTAPTAAGSYTVTATSAADASESASATVTVTSSAVPIAVSISPALVSLAAGGTQQFAVTVTGTGNSSVTWSASGGTISSAGLYTAPATAGTYSVTATSVADSSKSASAAVTVSASAPAISVSVSPSSASVQAGSTQQFAATVTWDNQYGCDLVGFRRHHFFERSLHSFRGSRNVFDYRDQRSGHNEVRNRDDYGYCGATVGIGID